jgi:hypothetical protein
MARTITALTNITGTVTDFLPFSGTENEYKILPEPHIKAVTFNAPYVSAAANADDLEFYVDSTYKYPVVFPIPDRDEKYVLLIENLSGSEKKVYVKAGDNPSWGAAEDLEVTVGASTLDTVSTGARVTGYDTLTKVAVTINSAKYSFWKAGTLAKGNIVVVTPGATVKVALVKLP